jgi:thymidylate kinase
VDCSGKSTQRELLLEVLRTSGTEPVTVYTRPGYTPGLRAIKRALGARARKKERPRKGVSDKPSLFPRRAANLRNPLARWLWVTMALLDLLWLYGAQLRLWRARGRTVVCNRYLLDALVDFRVNFPDERIEERWLCRWLRRIAVRPDAAFCLLIPADETMKRARAKARFHWETLDVLGARWHAYRALSDDLGVLVLDGARPVAEVARSIREGMGRALPAPERRLSAQRTK